MNQIIHDMLNLMEELTLMLVKFEHISTEGMKFILNDLNHHRVGPMLELHASRT